MKILGIVLLVMGLIATSFVGFNILANRKFVDIDPVSAAPGTTILYKSFLTAIVLVGLGGSIVLIARDEKRIVRNK